MSVTEPVIRQYEAYNAHDLEAFAACFSEDFTAYRPPATTPSLEGRDALYAFYKEHRFNNPALRAEIISRTAMGNKVFDHEKIHGLSDEPIESMAVFEVENGLIKTAWFFFG